MIKVLLDTNIVIDYMISREPFCKYADVIFDSIADYNIIGFISVNSITDVYYIIRKTYSDTDSRKKIKMLLDVLQVIEITRKDFEDALNLPISDFEDALVAVCAKKTGVGYIITRDIEFLKQSIAITPDEFISKVLSK